ncbi:MAG: rRNA pseudouridine synthase [Candidatus Pacebacteria bacterium]|jgi:pseudouridine synthase|nr:rRNA pseudouridine synthase [Candidatus Paceibacterota bacterium]
MKKSETKNISQDFPMRINKYLALRGDTTRLGADALIRSGRVTINGKKAELGSKVTKESDVVVITGAQKYKTYIAYNKPIGIVTVNPHKGEQAIKDVAGVPRGLFPVGRLDKDSRGLIILTNDGRITKRLLEPQFAHEKEYVVTIEGVYDDAFLKKMMHGVAIGDYITKPCKTKRLAKDRFSIILTEGKNRQIRRMCQALGAKVIDLERVRIINIPLGNLSPNKHRVITGEERTVFLSHLGVYS